MTALLALSRRCSWLADVISLTLDMVVVDVGGWMDRWVDVAELA
jgi:hypothetical protein